MRTSRWLVVLASSLVCVTALDAQRRSSPSGPALSRPSIRPRGVVRHGHARGRSVYPLGYRGYYSPLRYRGYYSPLGFYGGDYYPSPLGPYFGPSYSSLTVVSVAQPPPPQVIVIQAPPTILLERPLPEVPPRPELRAPEVPPVPGRPAPPADPKRPPPLPGKDPAPTPRPDKEKPKDPTRPPKRDAEPELPRPPGREADPRDEHARLVREGMEAFAEQQYGRAAERFRQAVRLIRAEPLPYFLLGQAQLAQGNFHDAFDAIRDGMRRRPDWPRARFRPIELYGTHVDEYSVLVRSTERALARHPLDPELLFLRGYVLWFDGRKEEARPFFRRALPRATNRDAIDRFLRALPDDATL